MYFLWFYSQNIQKFITNYVVLGTQKSKKSTVNHKKRFEQAFPGQKIKKSITNCGFGISKIKNTIVNNKSVLNGVFSVKKSKNLSQTSFFLFFLSGKNSKSHSCRSFQAVATVFVFLVAFLVPAFIF